MVRIAIGQLAGLSLFGLVLATIGLTGVTSYVARRRSEVGSRLALGAERLHVCWLVLREARSWSSRARPAAPRERLRWLQLFALVMPDRDRAPKINQYPENNVGQEASMD